MAQTIPAPTETTNPLPPPNRRDRKGETWARRGLAVLLCLYLALAALYSVVNPLFEAPDELWHFGFVHDLRTGQGLPVVQVGVPLAPPAQEAAQPPLYYAVAAALTSWVPSEDLAEAVMLNPAGIPPDPGVYGKRNITILLRPDAFPYSGEYLAAHLARLLSVLFGALTVVATWVIAREIVPSRPGVWILAAALNALIPQFLFISAAVSNDGLAVCLSSWGLLLSIRAAQRPPSARRTLLLGVVAGLGSLTKLSVLGLVPLGLVALALGSRRSRFRALPLHAALLLTVVLAITGWWLLRNLQLYGEPLALNVFAIASGGVGLSSFDPASLWADLHSFQRSFWAFFGWLNVEAEPSVYVFFDVLTLVGLLGLGLWIGRAWRRRGTWLVPIGIAVLWLTMIGAAFVKYQLSITAWHGRLVYPALAVICTLLALGLNSLPSLVRRGVVPIALALLLAVAVASPFRYIAPSYAQPDFLSESDLVGISHRIDARFGGQLDLLGSDVALSKAGRTLDVTLYWRAAATMGQADTASVQLLDSAGNRLAQRDVQLGGGNYPTRLWRIGDTIKESYRLTLPPVAKGPAIGRVLVSVYAPGPVLLSAVDEKGEPVGEVIATSVKLAGPPEREPSGPRVAVLGDEIGLDSFDLDRSVAVGGELRGELCWSALRQPDTDYTVFIQVLGPNGVVAQYDSQPLRGTYPTSFWEPSETVRDPFSITIGKDVKPGEYRVIAGIYELKTGLRLAVGPEDFVSLGVVQVVGAEG